LLNEWRLLVLAVYLVSFRFVPIIQATCRQLAATKTYTFPLATSYGLISLFRQLMVYYLFQIPILGKGLWLGGSISFSNSDSWWLAGLLPIIWQWLKKKSEFTVP